MNKWKNQKMKNWQAFVLLFALTALTAIGLYMNAVIGLYSMNGSVSTVKADVGSAVLVHVPVSYDQTGARSMLAGINAFRQGSEAWEWNSTDTEKITHTNLGELRIDQGLEQMAMLRAVEVALSFSHTRPNGKSCYTAYTSSSGGSYGENIAAGYSSAEGTLEQWKETNEKYSGQGHRRNMLNSSYQYIGIAHVRYQGRDYWVQEFSSQGSGQILGVAYDAAAVEEIEVLPANLTGISLTPSQYTLKVGEQLSVSDVKLSAQISGHWPSGSCLLNDEVAVTTADTGVVSVTEGKIQALSVGTANLTASVFGRTAQISVTVEEEKEGTPGTANPPSATQIPDGVELHHPLENKKVTGVKVAQKKKKAKMIVRFKKMEQADGYRIVYAQNQKMTKNRKVKHTESTSVLLPKLKHKKTYYVKVSAYYVDDDGNRCYSKASKTVKCRIR